MNTQLEGSKRPRERDRRSRRAVLVGAGALAFVLAAAGVVAAAAADRSTTPMADRSVNAPAPSIPAPTTGPTTVHVTVPPAPSAPPASPSVEPAPDPNALADGTYPTYVRDVDVHGATITVDVVQVFKRRAAAHAAMEDGVARRDARYLWIYLRNENDLLRTVPVARDVRIHFIGVCETPPNRHVALTELSDATTPFDTTFYYAITVVDGQIHRVGQHLAISGC
jgi:hypothetical protein